MYQGFQVVALVPTSGNARYLRLLLAYLQREKVFDEIRLWLTNGKVEDPAFIESLKCSSEDTRLRFEYADWEPAWTRTFYYNCTDPDTLYYKIDTDDVYIHEEAVTRLLDYRLEYTRPFVVSSNVVNNGLCDYLHEQQGNFDNRYGTTTYVSNTYTIYSGEFAAYLHRTFIQAVREGRVEDFFFPDVVLEKYEHWSINNYVFFGKDFAEFGGEHGEDGDEVFFGQIMPKRLGRPVEICGDSLVVHHAFAGQRKELSAYPEILDEYERLAGLSVWREQDGQ